MQTRRKKATTFVALLSLAAPAIAADSSSPATPVEQAYRIEQHNLDDSGSPPWERPHRNQLFSRKLAALFARDETCTTTFMKECGQLGNLDYDPFLNGQDGEVKNLHIAVTSKPIRDRAEVTASFMSFDYHMKVRFRMILENGAWKIDDIIAPDIVDGQDHSVVDQLNHPYDCSPVIPKSCQ